MKKHFFFFVLAFSVSCFAYSGGKSPSQPSTTETTPQPNEITPSPSSSPCDLLTPDQQQFAAGLHGTNQSLFCSIFSPEQRQQAMSMAKSSTKMTADQAVDSIAKSNNLSPKEAASSGGACGAMPKNP